MRAGWHAGCFECREVIVSFRSLLAALCIVAAAVTVHATGLISPDGAVRAQTPAGQSPPAQPTPSAQSTPPAGYAGSDTCVVCHTTEEGSLKGTAHGQAHNPRTPAANHGCESCHGPGQAHVD